MWCGSDGKLFVCVSVCWVGRGVEKWEGSGGFVCGSMLVLVVWVGVGVGLDYWCE